MKNTRFSAYGVAFSIRCPGAEEEMLPRIVAAFPPGWTPTPGGSLGPTYHVECLSSADGSYGLRADGNRLVFSATLDEVLEALEGELQLYVAEHAEPWLFLHAGVVGWGEKALLLPGESCAGKSTLVASMLRAGATYFSDEYAVLDADGLVHPYPRPLSLRCAGKPSLRVLPARLGARTGQAPLPVGLMAILTYRPGCATPPTLLRPGPALLQVLRHVMPARRRPAAALDLLSRLVRTTPVLYGPRGEAADIIRSLLDAVEASGAKPARPPCLTPSRVSA